MHWCSDNIINVNKGAVKIKLYFSHAHIPTTDKLTIRLKSRLNLLLPATDKTRLNFTYVKILTLLTNLLVNRHFAGKFVKKGADKIKQKIVSNLSVLCQCLCQYLVSMHM